MSNTKSVMNSLSQNELIEVLGRMTEQERSDLFKAVKTQQKQRKPPKEGYVVNPNTNRYIKIMGAVYRKLYKDDENVKRTIEELKLKKKQDRIQKKLNRKKIVQVKEKK